MKSLFVAVGLSREDITSGGRDRPETRPPTGPAIVRVVIPWGGSRIRSRPFYSKQLFFFLKFGYNDLVFNIRFKYIYIYICILVRTDKKR